MSSENAAKPIALEDRDSAPDDRLYSPSAARNKDPILQVLRDLFPAKTKAKALEIASGTGEHAAHICKALKHVSWTPSDRDPSSRASIAAWGRALDLPNLGAPLDIDACEKSWPVETEAPFDALISINMVHIAPWEACLGVLAGAGAYLKPGGALYFYGPFMRAGRHISASNEDFDSSLKARDPAWGVRDMDDVEAAAREHGLTLAAAHPMPANNFSVIFRMAADE